MLHDDFGMYFGGTFVGYRNSDGKVYPFQVGHVSNDDELYDRNSVPRDQRDRADHGDDAHNALVFHGTAFLPNGRTREMSVHLNRGQLILELPDSRYIKLGERHVWVQYRSNRSTKKGIESRKLVLPRSIGFDHRVVAALYDESPDNLVFGGVFLKCSDGRLEYKGVTIGEIDVRNNISLDPDAQHLQRTLQREIPNCQITVRSISAG